jgi:hypothetical protein
VSLVARTDPSRGRSQRLLLVSVGTTFCTDNQFDHDGKQDAGTSGATGIPARSSASDLQRYSQQTGVDLKHST